MKKRKVGKMVSLLVATILVATAMIPAAGVLAESIEAAANRNAVISVTNLDALHAHIKSATNANGYSDKKPIQLRLDADIEIPLFYCLVVKGTDKYTTEAQGGISILARAWIGYAAGDFRVDGIPRSYDNTVITIPEGAYVSLDLNGHALKMSDDYKTRGKGLDGKIPDPEDTSKPLTTSTGAGNKFPIGKVIDATQTAPVITVKGQLTVKDTSSGQTGSISGGTGSYLDAFGIDNGHDGRLPYKTGDGKSVYALKVRDNVRTLRLEKAPAMNTVGGGGVLVRGPNAVFNFEGGNIRDNFVWIGENYELYTASNDGYVRYSEGGGVCVRNGATFNMSGGRISNNVARAYHGNKADGTRARGGGVFVDNNCVMNFTGGRIENNSTYSRQTKSGSGEDIPKSNGGGIFVHRGGVLNMCGPDNIQDMSDLDNFPIIANNMSGTYLPNGGWGDASGAGLYVRGTANLRHAVITGNSFSRFQQADYTKESRFVVETVLRDPDTGKVIYVNPNNTNETINPDTGEPYEAGDTINGARVTPKTSKSTSTNDTWLYGVYTSAKDRKVFTNGAGVFIDGREAETALNIGEQVWIYDNWDLVSTNFVNDCISQDDVCLTLDAASNYVHKDSFISLAAPAHESKIGVNVIGGQKDRPVGIKAKLPTQGTKAYSGFVSVFGDYRGNYTPQQTDVQFFWDNGANGGTVNNPAPDYAVIYSPTKTTVNANSSLSGAVYETPTYLLFGAKTNAYANGQYKGYVMKNYNEADIHYYAHTDYDGEHKNINWRLDRNSTPLTFEKGNTVPFIAPLNRPNYDLYKSGWIGALKNKDGNFISTAGETSVAYNVSTGEEYTDLYFKGWEFYAPYGHRTIPPLNFMNPLTPGDADNDPNDPKFRHSFTADNLLTWNDNELHQSVPAYTAKWYTRSELAAARQDISVTKGALLIGKDGKVYIRVAALLGGYMTDLQNVQPSRHTAADGTELYFNKPTFVASYTNATPTLEGGYKTTTQNGTPFEARITKKLISNATNKKVTLDTWNYVPGNNSAFAGDAWTQWNVGKNHHNKFGDPSFLGIMWVDIDTGITYNSETQTYTGDTSKVIYVTPCVEVTDFSGNTHYSYYYGESRAYSVDQLIAADNN